jgi:hypothetical protein
MNRTTIGAVTAVCAVVAILAAAASAAGVFLRGDLATTSFVTVRGEKVDVLAGGVYRYNGLAIAAEGVGWDLVTLFLVVPALALTLPALHAGSLRARLLATGLLAYFAYQYFEYATFLAYGPLFALYVAIGALSLSGIGLLVAGIDLRSLPDRISARFPRRGVMGLGLYVAILLAGLWLPLIARTFDSRVVDQLDGATTLVVQAFDLGVLVPLGLFTVVAVQRRLAIGFVLGAVIAIKATAMGTAIAAMLAIEALATGVAQPVPMAIFAVTALLGGLLAARVVRSVDPRAADVTTGTAAGPLSREPATATR